MDRIIGILAEQAELAEIRSALQQIKTDVIGGARLAEAFSKFPDYFPPVYISMLELGQSAGILDKTLREMTELLEKEQNILSKLKTALLYPKIVGVTLIGVTWVMLVFVFPPFKSFYDSHQAVLPLPTRIVMNVSDILTQHWYLPLIVIPMSYFLWQRLKKIPSVDEKLSIAALKIPVFGHLNMMSSNARFANMVSALYRVGLPLPQILSVIATVMENHVQRREVELVKTQIESGKSLHEAMKPLKYFSPLIKETCLVGEQTGKLDTTLSSTGKFYNTEVDEMLANLSTLIEPFMLFGLFGIVLLLALAVYLPIWNVSNVVLQ
jgi:type IV pilus assembly protein PilC